MPLGYRSLLHTDARHTNQVTAAIAHWAMTKKHFLTLPHPGTVLTNSSDDELVATETTTAVDGVTYTAHRWRLTQDWTPPRWYTDTGSSPTAVTTLTRITDDRPAEHSRVRLWTDITPPVLHVTDSAGHPRTRLQTASSPSVVLNLLDTLPMQAGGQNSPRHLARTWIIDTATGLDELLTLLRDPERLGVVYLLHPDDTRCADGTWRTDWRSHMGQIIGHVAGMDTVAMLSPRGRRIYQQRIEAGEIHPAHATPPGGMRTVLPGALLDEHTDAARHPIMQATTISSRGAGHLYGVLRGSQNTRLEITPLPEPYAAVDRAFRHDQAAITAAAQDAVTNAASTTARQPDTDTTRLLELALEENQALLELNAALIAAEDAAQDRACNLETRLRATTEERDHLREHLIATGPRGVDAAHSWRNPDTVSLRGGGYPVDFADLLTRLHGDYLPGVRYFGDPDQARALDDQPDLGTAALHKAWEALVTFSVYATARATGDYGQSLNQFIGDTRHGLPMRIPAVQWTESKTVRTHARMAAQRTVTGLPASISATGELLLVAHIPLATSRGLSPRLYFADTVHEAGFVTIGHIGPHLNNTRTD